MKRLYRLAILAAALAGTGAADAQRGPGGPPMGGPGGAFGLLMFDANNDGKITRAELDAGLKARFAEADTNKDGFVTPEEMRAAMMKRRIEMRFAALDTDHNGQISKSEFEAGMSKFGGPGGDRPYMGRFGGPDGRGGPRMMGQDGPGGPGGQGGGQGGPGPRRGAPGAGGPRDGAGPQSPPDGTGAPRVRRMGPADVDGDGKLSFEEFAARDVAAFERADADKNGVVTIAELRALAGAPR